MDLKIDKDAKISIKIERVGNLACVTIKGGNPEDSFQFGIDADRVSSERIGDIEIIEIAGRGRQGD